MPSYTAPIKDFQFVLHDVLQMEKLSNQLGFTDASRDVIDAVLEEGGKFMSEVTAPLNQSGDQEGCHWDNGVVTTPKGFKEAYRSEEHTSELQSLMRISYAVFCLKKKKTTKMKDNDTTT